MAGNSRKRCTNTGRYLSCLKDRPTRQKTGDYLGEIVRGVQFSAEMSKIVQKKY